MEELTDTNGGVLERDRNTVTLCCKNCDYNLTGKYCHNCGQSASTHPLNFYFLWHDIQHGLFHVDKGILFTLKELFTRPGYTIKEYIHGKRARHFKPISLVLVLAGIFGLLLHYFEINFFVMNATHNTGAKNVNFQKINDWIGSHMTLIQLMQLPIFSLGSWLAFKKSNYNFVEHLVLNAFVTSQRFVISLMLFPLLYVFNGTEKMTTVMNTSFILGAFVTTWTFIQFFNDRSKAGIILRTILTYFYFFVAVILIGITVSAVWVAAARLKH